MPNLPLNNISMIAKNSLYINSTSDLVNECSQWIKNDLFPNRTLTAVGYSCDSGPPSRSLCGVIPGGLNAAISAPSTEMTASVTRDSKDLQQRWQAIFKEFSPNLICSELRTRLSNNHCYPLAANLLSSQMSMNFDLLEFEGQFAILSILIEQLSRFEKNHASDLLNKIFLRVLSWKALPLSCVENQDKKGFISRIRSGKPKPPSWVKWQDKIWVLISRHCLSTRFSNLNVVFRLLIEASEKVAEFRDLNPRQQENFKIITEHLAEKINLLQYENPDEFSFFSEVITSRRKLYDKKG